MSVFNSIHARIFIFIVLFIFLASCGIEDIPRYLYYSPRVYSASLNALNFLPPTEFEPLFFGIEICYKIYASKSDGDAEASNFASRQNSDLVPGTSILSYLLSSNNMNYHRLVIRENTQVRFIITKDKIVSTESLLTIELNNDKEIEFKINNITIATLYRNPIASPVSFSVEPHAEDSDYKTSNSDTDPDYYIQFYAVSYGYTNSLQAIYSKAELLGVLTIAY